MRDVLDVAHSSRSRCRECRKEIEEGELRFGGDREGMYADGAVGYGWYHPRCAARRLPERLLAVLKNVVKSDVEDYDALFNACSLGLQKALSKYPYGERAPTGRARCIECKEAIPKDAFRVAVETEIVTDAFTRTAPGYLHPACAVAHIGDPGLGKVLLTSSSMLTPADRKLLAAECDAAAAVRPIGAAPTKTQKPAPAPPKPRPDVGAELVLADELMDCGDVRGELIALEAQLGGLSPADARFVQSAKRAEALRPKAIEAWKKELGKKKFTLERGLPAIEVPLGPKAELPDERWLTAVRATTTRASVRKRDAAETSLAKLIQAPHFARVRHLTLSNVPFTWAGFAGFCACHEVEYLEALDIQHLGLGPRALVMLLRSSRFSRLTRLRVVIGFSLEPDATGFEGVAGLPLLTELRLPGLQRELSSRLVRSPLAQRLTTLEIDAAAVSNAALPNLRQLLLRGVVPEGAFAELAKNRSLRALEFLDLSEAFFDPNQAAVLADKKSLPSLKGFALAPKQPRPGAISRSVLEALRARFGERLLCDTLQVEEPAAKTAAKSAKGKRVAKRAR